MDFLNLVSALRNDGKCSFMSTHDIFRAKSIANRIGIMRKGKLITVIDRVSFLKSDLEQIYLEYIQTS